MADPSRHGDLTDAAGGGLSESDLLAPSMKDGTRELSGLICVNDDALLASAKRYMWQSISTAPFDRDLELAVIDRDGPHTLVFSCRRVLTGWIKSSTKERVEISPTHWRAWDWDKKTV